MNYTGSSSVLSNSKSSVLKNIANSNEVAQIIEVANIVQESAVKYINGQIDEREFIEEVGVKGTTMVVGMIGGEVGQEIGRLVGATIGTAIGPGIGTAVGYLAGGVVGEILGTIITTVACSAIMTVYTTSKNLDSYKLTDKQIKVLEKEALDEMERQRNKFREIVQREYKVWDEEIQKGLDHTGIPHGGVVIRSGVTGANKENKHIIEYKLTLDSNPEFTSSVLCCYARAAYKMNQRGESGCKTVFDVAPADLTSKSYAEIIATLL